MHTRTYKKEKECLVKVLTFVFSAYPDSQSSYRQEVNHYEMAANNAVPSTSHNGDMPLVNTSLETLNGIDSSSTPNSSRSCQVARGRGRGKGHAVYQGNAAKKSKVSKKRLQPEAAEDEEEEVSPNAVRNSGRKEIGPQNRSINNNRKSDEGRRENEEEEKDDVQFLHEEKPSFPPAPLEELIRALQTISFRAMREHDKLQDVLRKQCREAAGLEKRCSSFEEERKRYLDRIAELEKEVMMLKASNGHAVTSSTVVVEDEETKYQACLASLGYSPVVKREIPASEEDPYGILRILHKK